MNSFTNNQVSKRPIGLSISHRGINLTMMSLYKKIHTRRVVFCCLLAVTLCMGLGAQILHAQTSPPPVVSGEQSTAGNDARSADKTAEKEAKTDLPIMRLDDVRIGMKGYGLTVFNGVRIEPFAVEVISVQRDFSAQRGVVWVRCPDDRMQLSGPVHGMSGSPIFLWPLGEEHELGQGGKVIGAFAFGYQSVKDCYVGIQPIEYMLQAAARLVEPDASKQGKAASGETVSSKTASSKSATAGNPAQTAMLLRRFIAAATAEGAPASQNWQATALAKIIDPASSPSSFGRLMDGRFVAEANAGEGATLTPAAPPELAQFGQPRRLLVPMSVGSPLVARVMAGVLEPLGLEPLAGVNSIAGQAPVEIDPNQVAFAPGSVLAVPLAWGDLDLSASGTVTALTTDGHVVGFGHAMFGDGATALPLATGYVHFVMPNTVSSFKLGGSLQLKGAILRDEQTAVVGSNKGTYTQAPVNVSVSLPGQPVREYKYQVVHHQTMTPMLAAMVAMQSITAVQNPPTFNTMHVVASLRFSDTEVVNIDTMLPMADPSAVVSQIMPALMLMSSNAYESRQIQSVDIHVEYQTEVLTSTLVRGRINKTVVAPGDDVDITLWLQPYGKELQSTHVNIQVPSSLPDGDYQLLVGGSQAYMGMVLGTRPHLSSPTDINSLFGLIKRVMEADNTAMYVLLQSGETALAVGQQEMPSLPSSRKALLEGSGSTLTTPYMEWIEKKFDTTNVIEGQQAFTLHVRRSRDLSQPTP